MFDDLIRALEELEAGVALSVPFQIDDDGYFDRQCPWSECGFTFKVLFEDWGDKVPDEWAYCPFCRPRAEPTELNTPEQIEYLKQLAYNEVLQRYFCPACGHNSAGQTFGCPTAFCKRSAQPRNAIDNLVEPIELEDMDNPGPVWRRSIPSILTVNHLTLWSR